MKDGTPRPIAKPYLLVGPLALVELLVEQRDQGLAGRERGLDLRLPKQAKAEYAKLR